jgi:hypothetical protein
LTSIDYFLQCSLYTGIVDHILLDDQNITDTSVELINILIDEYKHNIHTNASFLSNTYMYQKKFILLTNFFTPNMSAFNTPLGVTKGSADVSRLLAMNAIDYLQTKSLFVHNIQKTAWQMQLVFEKNNIDRHLSTLQSGQRYDNNYCSNFYNSK